MDSIEHETWLEVTNHTLVWNIHNFDTIPYLSRHINGHKFILGDESEWLLIMTKEIVSEKKCLGFKMRRKQIKEYWEAVTYSLTLKSEEGLCQTVLRDIATDGSDDTPFSYVEEPFLFKDFLECVHLTVECTIQHMYNKDESELLEPADEEQLILTDMKSLNFKCYNTDIKLITKERAEFPCHKSILCARSVLFNLQCQELGEISHLYVNLDTRTADALISYIYTCEMPHKYSVEDYRKLYWAAKLYSVDPLVAKCQEFLNAKGKISCFCPICKASADTDYHEEILSTDEDD